MCEVQCERPNALHNILRWELVGVALVQCICLSEGEPRATACQLHEPEQTN
jgi:hypothetical protein